MSKKQTAIKETQYSDPTPERLKKSGGHFDVGDDKQGSRIYTFRDSAIDRLKAKDAISGKQYRALKRFYVVAYTAGRMGNTPSPDMDRVHATDTTAYSHMARTDEQAEALKEYREAVKAMGLYESSIVSRIVLDEDPLEAVGKMLCGWKHPLQARAAAIEVLRCAADRMAKVFFVDRKPC